MKKKKRVQTKMKQYKRTKWKLPMNIMLKRLQKTRREIDGGREMEDGEEDP